MGMLVFKGEDAFSIATAKCVEMGIDVVRFAVSSHKAVYSFIGAGIFVTVFDLDAFLRDQIHLIQYVIMGILACGGIGKQDVIQDLQLAAGSPGLFAGESTFYPQFAVKEEGLAFTIALRDGSPGGIADHHLILKKHY